MQAIFSLKRCMWYNEKKNIKQVLHVCWSWCWNWGHISIAVYPILLGCIKSFGFCKDRVTCHNDYREDGLVICKDECYWKKYIERRKKTQKIANMEYYTSFIFTFNCILTWMTSPSWLTYLSYLLLAGTLLLQIGEVGRKVRESSSKSNSGNVR